MANPKRRHSRSRRDKRRANWKLEPVSFNKCPQCGADVLSHTACPKCGFYNGKIAVVVKAKAAKAEADNLNNNVQSVGNNQEITSNE